jgi:hypothetical protein
MKHRSHGTGRTIVTALAFVTSLFAFASASAQSVKDSPDWLSRVAPLRCGDKTSFQFRVQEDALFLSLSLYVSWAPPNHRCVIVCDRADGLPVLIAVDGEAWIYDLIGGQILHLAAEPVFELYVGDDKQLTVGGGFLATDRRDTIRVDFASVFNQPDPAAKLEFSRNDKKRTATLSYGPASGLLQVTAADPPRPTDFTVTTSESTPPSKIQLHAFRFGARQPAWHRALDSAALAREAPLLDLKQSIDLPPEKQDLLDLFNKLIAAGATFLVRPALRDESVRRRIESGPVKLNFDQIQLHEKLLHEAWRQALQHQGFDPAKFASPSTFDEKP